MIIKKFTGKTEEDATATAQKELGGNIVIMNVRPLKRTGFLSFLKPKRTEVTVALEEEKEKEHQTVPGPANFPVVRPVIPAQEKKDTPAGEQLAKASAEGVIPPLKVGGAVQNEIVKTVSKPDENSVIEEKLDNLHSLLEQNMLRPENQKTAAQEKEKATSQKDVVKTEKEKVSEEILSFIKLLYNTLLENEVDEIYANELTDEIEKISKPNMPFEYALSNVYQKMVLKFGKPETIQPAKEGLKAEIFIGPTGVGKTTTIAKLASMLYVTEKKKVALLTMDTYRIAAAEQLRTYASILEIPFRVIYSIEEMKQAEEDFRDYDYLMVDTAGHSFHNEEQKNNISEFIHVLTDNMESDIFLVLSATTKYRDLLEIADSYSELLKYKLIFTKMDETGAAGNLYNLRMHTGASMSYITDGQNVPDDIAVFDAQRIVKGLLGGKK